MENKNREQTSRLKRALGWLAEPTHALFSFVWVIPPAFFIAWMAFSSDHKLGVLEAIDQTGKEISAKIDRLTEIGEKIVVALNTSQKMTHEEQNPRADVAARTCDCTVDAFDPEFQGFGDWPADWSLKKKVLKRAGATKADTARVVSGRGKISVIAGDDLFRSRTGFDF
jgi:hypothetical protein